MRRPYSRMSASQRAAWNADQRGMRKRAHELAELRREDEQAIDLAEPRPESTCNCELYRKPLWQCLDGPAGRCYQMARERERVAAACIATLHLILDVWEPQDARACLYCGKLVARYDGGAGPEVYTHARCRQYNQQKERDNA